MSYSTWRCFCFFSVSEDHHTPSYFRHLKVNEQPSLKEKPFTGCYSDSQAAPEDLVAATAAVLWTNSKPFSKYESFQHLNIDTWGCGLKILETPLKLTKLFGVVTPCDNFSIVKGANMIMAWISETSVCVCVCEQLHVCVYCVWDNMFP